MGEKINLDKLQECLSKLESKLGWGSSETWTTYDFEKLSQLIWESTKVNLSVTTLKRVWGKLSYPHDPSITTLNSLAAYIGYEDWRAFLQADVSVPTVVGGQSPDFISESPSELLSSNKFNPLFHERAVKLLTYVMTTIAILVIAGFVMSKKTKPILNPNDFQFSANKIISVGVPNSVVFGYDASQAHTDSIFICQTWDYRRKTLVPKTGKNHSAIYYYPGYFRTKLVIDGVVVKTHDLQIATDGWLALIETDEKPIYIDKEDVAIKGDVDVNKEVLAKYYQFESFKSPRLRIFNQNDLGDLHTADFTFETKLKADFDEIKDPCPLVQVLIQCKDDIIIIPLTSKPCIGDISLTALGAYTESKYADLSKFGVDLKEWTQLKIVGQGQKITCWINGIEAYAVTYPHKPSGIVGLQYRFPGAGALKETSLKNDHKAIGF